MPANRTVNRIAAANIIALSIFLVLCFFYDSVYGKYFPYQYMKCMPGNYIFQFGVPVITSGMNWWMMRGRKIYLRLLISIVLMLVVAIAFDYLISLLNIDSPFILPSGLMAI